jgi:hypothetical protein
MNRIVERKRYNTKTATLLASDEYWDGSNWDRCGRNMYLYRTPRGAYFTVTTTRWQGERDSLDPVSLEEAVEIYERLPKHGVGHEEAFPEITVEDA